MTVCVCVCMYAYVCIGTVKLILTTRCSVLKGKVVIAEIVTFSET